MKTLVLPKFIKLHEKVKAKIINLIHEINVPQMTKVKFYYILYNFLDEIKHSLT